MTTAHDYSSCHFVGDGQIIKKLLVYSPHHRAQASLCDCVFGALPWLRTAPVTGSLSRETPATQPRKKRCTLHSMFLLTVTHLHTPSSHAKVRATVLQLTFALASPQREARGHHVTFLSPLSMPSACNHSLLPTQGLEHQVTPVCPTLPSPLPSPLPSA